MEYLLKPIKEGEVQLNAGVGISGWGVPVYIGLDYGISKDVTLGGQLSFQTDNDLTIITVY